METLVRLTWFAALLVVAGEPQAGLEATLVSGDVVLQRSMSARAPLIAKATQSRYTHVGLVEVRGDQVYVIEAGPTVRRTPFRLWAQRGVGHEVTVLRAELSVEARERVVSAAGAHVGKSYDALYGWGDERLYCSELVAKAYQAGAQLTVGRLQRLNELALSEAELAEAARHGLKPTLEVLSPASLAEDEQFKVIAERKKVR